MINDNPARVAPPESPVEVDFKKLQFDFLNSYLEADNMDSDFHVKLEEYIYNNGLIHQWMRMLYTKKHDQVELDMQDLLNFLIHDYLQEEI
tara:strand:+ start:114 stop:386 length:273 start_codon:yes stop_codon:yes gene_type:complete